MTLSAEGRQAMQEIAQEAAHKTGERVKTEILAAIPEIVKETTKETMSNLGQDVSNKQEAQKDFLFLRETRVRSERIKEHKAKAIWGAVVSFIAGAAMFLFKGGQSG